jgi:hypothetical protein
LLCASVFSVAAGLTPAFAAGVTLISQATVQTSGGFPYVIAQSGSYQLSSNLVVPCGSGANGINITASNVTVDLNGFTISCSATNTATGIQAGAVTGITIMNGAVTGFGSSAQGYGIDFIGGPAYSGTSWTAKAYQVQVTQNGTGIYAGENTLLTVAESVVNNNAAYGIFAGSGRSARIQNSQIDYNLQAGIVISQGSVSACDLTGNPNGGVLVAIGANITNNSISGSNVGIGPAPLDPEIIGIVGYGSNTFFNAVDVAQNAGAFVSMKNNVSSSGVIF